MKKNLLLLFTLFTSLSLLAQTADRKWAIGLHGGQTHYNGDLGMGFYHFDQPFYGFGGLSLSRYLNPSFDFVLSGTYGHHGFYENDQKNFMSVLGDVSATFRLKLNPKDNAAVVPYLFIGIGAANQYEGRNIHPGDDVIFPGGFGINFKLGEKWALQLQETFAYTNHDDRELESHDYNDGYLHHTLGLVHSFGKMIDTDNDRVSDKKDKCPNTPVGVKVDLAGCPIDTDADGIADYLDRCPEVKGVKTTSGCPDADGDSIVDAKDKCPKEYGLPKNNGCPDADDDGVIDAEDNCPKVKGVAKFKGCPDADEDGIQDAFDACPTQKGIAKFKGCPDTDGDGVADSQDRCPVLAGTIANQGCPEVKKEVILLFQKALQGIQFETGKDKIKKLSFPILNDVVTAMKENPSYKLTIAGHTDDVGNDKKNMVLSQNRADAVKKYLLDHGVSAKRIVSSIGYGETRPVESNRTAAGKAKNRRVEFKVEF